MRRYAEFVLPTLLQIRSHHFAKQPLSSDVPIKYEFGDLDRVGFCLVGQHFHAKRVLGLSQRQCVPLELLPQDFDHTAV